VPADTPSSPTTGYTTSDLARRYRVSQGKIRQWIQAGELRALNTSSTACA